MGPHGRTQNGATVLSKPPSATNEFRTYIRSLKFLWSLLSLCLASSLYSVFLYPYSPCPSILHSCEWRQAPWLLGHIVDVVTATLLCHPYFLVNCKLSYFLNCYSVCYFVISDFLSFLYVGIYRCYINTDYYYEAWKEFTSSRNLSHVSSKQMKFRRLCACALCMCVASSLSRNIYYKAHRHHKVVTNGFWVDAC